MYNFPFLETTKLLKKYYQMGGGGGVEVAA